MIDNSSTNEKDAEINVKIIDEVNYVDDENLVENKDNDSTNVGVDISSEAKSKQYCSKCGKILNKNERFCSQCGNAIADAEGQYCKKCGSKLEKGTKFCSNCGTKVEKNVVINTKRILQNIVKIKNNKKIMGIILGIVVVTMAAIVVKMNSTTKFLSEGNFEKAYILLF